MSTIPTSADLFADAGPYLRRNHWIKLRAEIVRELIGEPEGQRILDLGCGNGAVSLPFGRSNRLTLVDNSEAMLDAARVGARAMGVSGCEFVGADAGSIALGQMDIVLALGLLSHVQSIDEVMGTISRHLAPGGLAVVQMSDKDRLLNKIGRAVLAIKRRKYRPMSKTEVLASALAHRLVPVAERTHILVVPGMQRLMGYGLVPFDRFVRRHPRLARHGTETILLLRKED